MKHELELLLGRPVIVALSGGGDSMALLHLARDRGLAVIAAHVDHGLRPDSSEEISRLRGWLPDVEILCKRVPVAEKAREWGLGVEAAGRRLRYSWLRRLARERGAVVVTGHNREDVAETVLIQMLQGTSVTGLSGPRRWRGHWLFRPMLQVSGVELRDYLRERGLPWLEDPTNGEERFLRSWIRQAVVPLLETRNPRLGEGLARLAVSAEEMRKDVARRARRLHTGPTFAPERLVGLPLEVRFRVWASAWRAAGPSSGARFARKHFELGEDWLAAGGPGRLQLPGWLFAERHAHGLTIGAERQSSVVPQAQVFDFSGGGPWELALPDWGLKLRVEDGDGTLEPTPWQADLRVGEGPLTLRGRRTGDRFGSAKLKKYLLQWGIAQSDRDGVPLLCDGQNQVMWAVGYRVRREFLAGPGEPCRRFYFTSGGDSGGRESNIGLEAT